MTYIIAEPCIDLRIPLVLMSARWIASTRPKTRPKNSKKKKSSISILRSASTVGLVSRSAPSKRSLKKRRLRISGNTLFRSTPTGTKQKKANNLTVSASRHFTKGWESLLSPSCFCVRQFDQNQFLRSLDSPSSSVVGRVWKENLHGSRPQERSDGKPAADVRGNRRHRAGLSRIGPGQSDERAARAAAERRGKKKAGNTTSTTSWDWCRASSPWR